MKRLMAVLVAGIFAVILSAGFATPAYALGDCRDAPAPSPPRVGLAGALTSPPDKPVTGDPFANPTIPLHHVYGTSWHWSTYDIRGLTPGDCMPTTDSAVWEVNNASGNLLLSLGGAAVGVLDALERLARESSIGWFADWIGTVTAAAAPMVMGGSTVAGWQMGLLPLALLVAGIVVAWRARRADLSEAARTAGIAVVCVALAALVFGTPGAASRTVDDAVTTAAEVSGTAFSASLTDGVNRHALYTAWLAGQFGDANSKLAQEHGPALFDATHYTWAEWARIEADPSARKAIDAAKADKYKAVAKAVEDASPATYAWFQGKRERTGAALFALVALGLMGWFAFVAFVTVLVARVMMQVLVIAAPIAAVAGLLPKGGSTLRRMLNLFVAALFAVFKFTLAAGVMAVALGLLSTLPPVTALIWMTVLTVAALAVLKPIKTFKTVIPGLDPNRSYFRELIDAIKNLSLTAATAASGGAAGVAVAGAAAVGPGASPAAIGPGQPARDRVDLVRMPARPPEPAPVFVQVAPGRFRPEVQAGPGGARREIGPTPPPARDRALPPGTAGPSGPAPVAGATPRPVLTAVPGAAATSDTTPNKTTPNVTPAPVRTVGPGPTDAPVTGPVTIQQAVPVDPRTVVIPGEIVGDTTLYRRPEPVADQVVIPDLSHVRDKGTDQPAGEIVLYRSKEPAHA